MRSAQLFDEPDATGDAGLVFGASGTQSKYPKTGSEGVVGAQLCDEAGATEVTN